MAQMDVWERLATTLGGAYRLERELGGGGMSRVFAAEESSLGRRVVVKILRPDLVEGISAERFKREVKLAARLQHPHIVPLLAAGELDGGVLYYTMPYVEGESLRARIEREGGLPVAEAARLLEDVARALAYAHRAGVVHRDIKPENVLLSDGHAVVADFGIAKAIRASLAADAEGGGDGRRSSTLTAAGTSLGTPAYMAPEQAVGDAVDHRADLYALGVVAYEMLSGRPPFDGRTARQLLAAHATEAPEPLARRRPAVPPPLEALVMRLLEKHPSDRPQSADEVLRALGQMAAGDAPPPAPGARQRAGRTRVAALVLGGAALAAAGAALGSWLARGGESETSRLSVVSSLPAPPGLELRPDGGMALSPDGSRLAFTAADGRGATAVWVRSLDSLDATRIEGTEGGMGPFWSPDGGALGFFAGGQLRIADLRGGARRALCPAERPGGGTWTKNGIIVYAPDFLGLGLYQVPAGGGGRCTELTHLRANDGERHSRPSALPDGEHVLFNAGRTSATAAVVAVNLATGVRTEVRRPGYDAQVVGPDRVLFRERAGGAIYAQRIDLATLRTVGEPTAVLDRSSSFRAIPSFTVSQRSLVAMRPSGGGRAVVWVNRQSQIVDSAASPVDAEAFYGGAASGLSRDGRRIAIGGLGLWLYDRDRGVATRVRAEAMEGQGMLDPSWAPGDSLIAYSTIFVGPITLRLYHVRSGTSDSLFSSGRNVRWPDWSPDGRRIAFQLSAADSAPLDEIWIYSFAERRAARAWEATGNLSTPRWSPDGNWLAYVSDETGAPEVYLRPVSGGGAAVRVSTAGGDLPRWRGDGRELYYRAPSGAILAVSTRLGATAGLSVPRVVLVGSPFARNIRSFDVTADGEQFVAFERGDRESFTLVTDWIARLPRR